MIAYAGEKGKGVTAGKPAQDMLRQALKDGQELERQAAMEQIYRNPDTGMIIDLMHILYGNEPDLREAAFNTLWHLDLDGIDFPPPAQFGIGPSGGWT